VDNTVHPCLVKFAIAGLSFAASEFAASFALVNFPANGWATLHNDIPARWALGTEMHIIWGATTWPLAALGISPDAIAPGKPIYSALLINLMVIPILLWEIWWSRERHPRAVPPHPPEIAL
jgi:hypothetical protein